MPAIEDTLRTLPDQPGVYKFLDARGQLLYVGKAASLRNRVRSYFQKTDALSPKVQRMVAEIARIEYLLAASPVQSLLWEADLVKNEQPRYNVRLRDDKHYPYIRVTLQEDWPRMQIARRIARDGARYFGPFTDSTAVRQTMQSLSRVFPRVLCDWPRTPRTRPCIYYDIKRCPAPCVGYIDQVAYRDLVQRSVRFLEGRAQPELEAMRAEMEAAAEALEFERAARLRDRLRAMSTVVDQQKVIYESLVDQDVLGLAREQSHACVVVFVIRAGRLLRSERFPLAGVDGESESELLAAFVTQYYQQTSELPEMVLLPASIEDVEAVGSWLAQLHGRRVEVAVPLRGEKRRVVELANANAHEALERLKAEWLADAERTSGAVLELQEHLELPHLPQRIECYDISNTQGAASVGSMVVFEAGQPKRSAYRRFKIKTVVGPNDFASLQEVLRRRFKRAAQHKADEWGAAGEASWAELPDLVIIDGGKGQLGAALEVLRELDMAEIPTVGLAKEREELFREGNVEPLLLPRNSQSLFLVQRIRDEAHRFAITFHRSLRGKRSLQSALDEVPGIGPRRKQALLKQFGSVRGLRAASVEELAAVPGMTLKTAQALKAAL
ncbi:MAG: excinuclease ABC subunit UvrC [Chloroflexi bacterium]|nr:excinuclease ABC subunit UvrC [Chloroflexota bacterium]